MEANSQDAVASTSVPNLFRFIENHYFSLPSQGNVYTLVPLRSSTGNCKILIASLQKKILCIEYTDGKYLVHENPLACFPNGADIVSMNAYSRNNKHNIGLTMIVKEGPSEQCFLNLYSDWDVGKNTFSQEVTSCTPIQLSYIPYILYCTSLPIGSETVWLLSGSDWVIHLFRVCKETNRYQEESSKQNVFPEFEQVRGITLHLDILYLDNRKRRITATSGESGNVHLFDVDVSNVDGPVIKASRELNFDFPSSNIKIFHRRTTVPNLTDLEFDSLKFVEDDLQVENGPFTLVTTTLESCFVHSAFSSGDIGVHLPESENYDVVTCSLICDLDFDGINEIVLGTYGQTLLIYKESCKRGSKWELRHTLALPSPVLALAYEDVLGDGVKELIVSTMAGLHVFQSDPLVVSSLVISRLRKIKDCKL